MPQRCGKSVACTDSAFLSWEEFRSDQVAPPSTAERCSSEPECQTKTSRRVKICQDNKMETINATGDISPSVKKHALMKIVDELSDDQIARIISFALIVKSRTKELNSVSPGQLASLRGLVSLGGMPSRIPNVFMNKAAIDTNVLAAIIDARDGLGSKFGHLDSGSTLHVPVKKFPEATEST